MGVIIRPAVEDDVATIRDIYNYAIVHATATFDIEEKPLEERLEWFRETRPPHCILVAEAAGDVVGYASLRTFRTKPAYRFTAEDSVYIAPEHQGKGIGTLLMRELIAAGRRGGLHSVMAGIAEGNPASEALHERFGFQRVGHEREVGYKFERWIDVSWYQLML